MTEPAKLRADHDEPTLEVCTRSHDVAFVFWVVVAGSGLMPGAAIVLRPTAGAVGEIGKVGAEGTFAGEHLGFCYMLPFSVETADVAGALVSVGVDAATGCRPRPTADPM